MSFKGLDLYVVSLERKALTWEKLQKKGMRGPGCCILWKGFNESLIIYSCLSCPYTEQDWMELERFDWFKGGITMVKDKSTDAQTLL